ncbi:antitoxin HicB [Glutamicibacter ardleyensis]|uniref:antitoxin HicB n=1 Tax=Glutamicibacter ardleyensis TaxID=225894 RepID=UPI003FD222C4
MTNLPTPAVAAHYKYNVSWSPEDDEFIATVAEFPSLSWMDENQILALTGLRDLIAEVIQDMRDSGEEVPVPFRFGNSAGASVYALARKSIET